MPALTQDTLLDLVSDIYGAAMLPERWPHVLDRIADATQSDGMNLYLVGGTQPERHPTYATTDAAFLDDWADHYWQLDPWVALNDEGHSSQEMRLGRELVPHEELKRTAYYHEHWQPAGFLDTFAAIYSWDGHGSFSGVSGVRKASRGDYESEQVQLLQRIEPHLRQAFALDQRLLGATRESEVLGEALDRFATGVVVIDERGVIVRTNRAADAIVATCDGLVIGREGLRAERTAENQELRRCIARAATTASGRGIEAGGSLSIERPSGRRPFSVHVSPLGDLAHGLAEGRSSVLVLVSDPELRPEVPIEALRRLWHLTPAEASLASQVGAGASLAEAADHIGVKITTARQYLKRVFAKTGVNRQSELVALVARSLPPGEDRA